MIAKKFYKNSQLVLQYFSLLLATLKELRTLPILINYGEAVKPGILVNEVVCTITREGKYAKTTMTTFADYDVVDSAKDNIAKSFYNTKALIIIYYGDTKSTRPVDLIIGKPNSTGYDRYLQEDVIDEGTSYYNLVGSKLFPFVPVRGDQLFTPAEFKNNYAGYAHFETWKLQLNTRLAEYKKYRGGLRGNDVNDVFNT